MKTTLHIKNVKCEGCANTIKKRMGKLKQLSDVSVNVEEETISFDYPELENLIEAAELLSELGYPIDGYSNTLAKKARSYFSCAIGRFGN